MTETPIRNEGFLYDRDGVLASVDAILQVHDEAERSARTAEFVSARLRLLEESVVPRNFLAMSRPIKGFIHPETEIYRNILVFPFRVDDPEIYNMLFQVMGEIRSNPGWQGEIVKGDSSAYSY